MYKNIQKFPIIMLNKYEILKLICIHSKSFMYTCVLPGIIRHRQVSIIDVIAGSGGFPFSHLKSALNEIGYFQLSKKYETNNAF